MRIHLLIALALTISFSGTFAHADHEVTLEAELSAYQESLSKMGRWEIAYERGKKTLKVVFTCTATGIGAVASTSLESLPLLSYIVKIGSPTVTSHSHVNVKIDFEKDSQHLSDVILSSALAGGLLTAGAAELINLGSYIENSVNGDDEEQKQNVRLIKADPVISYFGSAQNIDQLLMATGCSKAVNELSLAWNAKASSSWWPWGKKTFTTISEEKVFTPGPGAQNNAVSADTGNGCSGYCDYENRDY